MTTDVVALTDIKLAFRLVESIDKQILADSSNMDAIQYKGLPSLNPVRHFFFGELDEPERNPHGDYRLTNEIDLTHVRSGY